LSHSRQQNDRRPRRFGRGDEAGHVHAGAGDEVRLFGPHQAQVQEGAAVVLVLEDDARPAQTDPVQHPRQSPQQLAADPFAEEEVAQPGDRVDDSRDPGEARGERSVQHRLDREVVDQVRAFAAVEPPQAQDGDQFGQRVHAFAVQWEGQPAEAFGLQAGGVFAGRGEQGHVGAVGAQGFCQRQAEVVKVPVGVGEKENFHSRPAIISR
jgi:hypothetical protein